MWAVLASVSVEELPRTSGVVFIHTILFLLVILGLAVGAGVLWRLWGLLSVHLELAKQQLA